MSLASPPVHPIPEETRRVAQAAFPRPSRFMQMRDRLGTIYDDAAFGALYPRRGHRRKRRGASLSSPSCSLLTP